MNKIHIILLSFSCLIANSQESELSKKFKANDWKTEINWFNSDTLILKTIKKKDSMWKSLTVEEKLKRRNQIWTERISFDSIGNLKYQDNRHCGISDYRKLKSIEITDNKIFVDFIFKEYNSSEEIINNKWFKIKNWTKNRIILIASDKKN